MLLEVVGLKKSFGSIVVADDLSLTIAPAEAVGIIGPNGAGKTTLFNLIAGGLSPSGGTIRFDGGDILERLGLLGRANVPAGSLTLLECKRLEMARALATALGFCCWTRSPAD